MSLTYTYIIIFELPWSWELQKTKFKVLALLPSFPCLHIRMDEQGVQETNWESANYLTNYHILYPKQGNIVGKLRTVADLSLAVISNRLYFVGVLTCQAITLRTTMSAS